MGYGFFGELAPNNEKVRLTGGGSLSRLPRKS
jgi:hypothetical protein